MQGRKSNGLSVFAEAKAQHLRKIQANDRFPCFACFDDQKEKVSCKQCCGKGWIFGSHPMVQFAEDFIQKRLGGFSISDMNNSSGQNSDFGQIGVRMSGSYDPRKTSARDVFSAASTKTVALADQMRDSNYLEAQQPLAQQYFCNECPSEELAIRGKRFHCLQCEDFDLCEQCFTRGLHTIHQMKQIPTLKKPDNATVVKQIKESLLKKSVKFFK